ncbi:hypothetical protein ACFVVP_39055 [Streptomyces sp. NPDC058128]|uniref:hypothetical protein n=1 Tax=Streptomyces sp. NPDC058128 TaxID=3346352 RepID=UPI0036E150CB
MTRRDPEAGASPFIARHGFDPAGEPKGPIGQHRRQSGAPHGAEAPLADCPKATTGGRGGSSQRTREDLSQEAKKRGIESRSTITKQQLKNALGH